MEYEDAYLDKQPDEIDSLEEARLVIAAMGAALRDKAAENARLAEEKRRDPLLRTMLNKAETEKRIHERVGEGKPFGLFFIDIDRFKDYNDTYGHPEGDKLLLKMEDLLLKIEDLLQKNFRRAGDSTGVAALEAGRYGGDEFLIIMTEIYTDKDAITAEIKDDHRSTDPHKQMQGAHDLLRRIEQELLENSEYSEQAKAVGFGFSIGSVLFDPDNPMDALALIDQADQAMYKNKRERGAQREKHEIKKPRFMRVRNLLGKWVAKVTAHLR